MDVIINRRRSVQEHGDIILTKSDRLYAIVYDHGEQFPYHLLCLNTFTIIQSYDSIPTNQELEDDVEEELEGIYQHSDSRITLR